jgi:phosphate transport system permease protein
LLVGAYPALKKFGLHFFVSSQWNPVTEEFGALVSVFGTIVTSVIAILLAVPLSFGIAFFITELAPAWLKRPIGTAIELLAAVPSIIYGMWGLFVFAPWFADHLQPWITAHFGEQPLIGALFMGPPMGIGMFTAGLILAIMVMPFITAMMRDVFDIVPSVLKESAYGLGATTWEVVRYIVIPYTKVGIVGSIMLGLGRALGETMAVTFVIGNAHSIHASLFMPGTTISSTLANEFTEAVGEMYTSSLIALGLILFFITIVVLAVAKLLLTKISHNLKGRLT